jgi:REP element-mobilizing transposase RayT
MNNNSSQKFRGKYRIPSARLPGWDYASPGAYFITICTAGRAHLFGQVQAGHMVLSPLGEIVRQEWEKSFLIRKELICDIYVIMPNHIHAIVRIVAPDSADGSVVGVVVDTHGRAYLPDGRASLQQPHGIAYRPPKSISSFVAGFKSAVTTRINEYRGTPGTPVWQTRFHDHIIRNPQEYERIAAYIAANPAKWKEDRYYEKK